MTFENSIKYT